MGCKKYHLPISGCDSCNESSGSFDATCVNYTGPTLTCSGINTGDDLETAIQKIDTILCSAAGDYSTYEMNCLPAYWGSSILEEATFVNAITSYACQIRQNFDAFVSSSYNVAISNITTTLNGVTNPNLVCTSAGVIISDDLSTILTKYCTKFSNIDSALDISSVVWNNCQTVPVPPTTIAGGFQILADQICAIEAGQQSLPTFNNVGSCLPAPLTSNDSLTTTIDKIKVRLCQSPTYLASNISWGCTGTPGSNTSIEVGIQQVVNKVNQISQAAPTFNPADFSVAATNPGDPCAGVTVSLNTPINQDRLVAVTVGDSSPGVLQAKLVAGSGVSLDYATNPGQVIINTAGTTDSYEVKANVVDDAPGFLSEKLNGGGSNGISVSPSYNPTTKQVDLIVDVVTSSLFDVLLDALDSNPTLYSKFCEKVRNCPSACQAPTNVQAIQVGGTTTTTTTSTTTTTEEL